MAGFDLAGTFREGFVVMAEMISKGRLIAAWEIPRVLREFAARNHDAESVVIVGYVW